MQKDYKYDNDTSYLDKEDNLDNEYILYQVSFFSNTLILDKKIKY